MVGSITIGTEIDTKGFEDDLEELKKESQDFEIDAWLKARGVEIPEDKVNAIIEELNKNLNLDVNTKSFDVKIAKAKSQILAYETALQHASELDLSGEERFQMLEALEEATNKLKVLNKQKEQLRKGDFNNLKSIDKIDFKGIGNGIKGIVRQVSKWALAIFGIRGAFNAIRSSMSIITQNDKQLSKDLQFMKTALAYTLEPIVRAIVNLMKYLVGIVGYVVKLLTGKDIFASASKNLKAGAKSAKEINKSMAGFDEANVLSKASGGSGQDWANYKFNGKDIFTNWDLNDFIEKGKELASNIAKGVNEFFAKTDWAKIAEYITLALSGIITIVDTFLNEIDWTLIGQSIATFILNIDWLKLGKDILKLIIDGITGAMDLVSGVTDGIIKKLEDPEFRKKLVKSGLEMQKAIIEGLGDIETNLQTVWSKIISFFLQKLGVKNNDANKIGDKMGAGITEGLETAFFASHPILWVFVKLIKAIKEFLGIHSPSKVMEGIGEDMSDGLNNGISNRIDKIKQPILTVVNSIIKGINKLIDGINKIGFDVPDWVPGIGGNKWGFNIKKIPEIKLAKGGIVNMPGRGIPVSAMAGERGQEGIIPLTDSQQMAMLGEAIGKYITINATIPVNMNGRLLTRELRKIQNESSFATNGGAF